MTTLRLALLALLFVFISACASAEPRPASIPNEDTLLLTVSPETTSQVQSPDLIASAPAPTLNQTLLARLANSPSPLATLTTFLSQTLTPTPSSQVLGIASATVNIRAGPSQSYPIVGSLGQGKQITIVGVSDDLQWWKFALGWVSASYVQVEQDTSNVPIVTPIALPPTSTCTATPTLPLLPTFTVSPLPPTLTIAPPPPVPATNTPRPGKVCCKICTKGKACGNSCISRSYTCHQPPGCACDG